MKENSENDHILPPLEESLVTPQHVQAHASARSYYSWYEYKKLHMRGTCMYSLTCMVSQH